MKGLGIAVIAGLLVGGHLISRDAHNVSHAQIVNVEASANKPAHCVTLRSKRPLDAADVRYIIATRRPDLIGRTSTITVDRATCGDGWAISRSA